MDNAHCTPQASLALLSVAAVLCSVSPAPASAADSKDLGNLGRFPKWTEIEISLSGPESLGRGEPNPFSIFVDVTFAGPTGKEHSVPGFYDGDGMGGLDGNVWRVRFSAGEVGKWSFSSTSKNRLLDGWKGWLTVVAVSEDAPGFYRWGRLEAVGTASNQIRYLKFRDGPYWLKAGCDDPENFLGNFRNYDTLAKRRAAVDYLAARGINSMYIMSHNIDGDHRDVWPWLGRTAAEAKSHAGADARFDVTKLDQWRQLFEYMQTKGVVPYLVLEDDSAWSGYDHARYYREIIARFGYLPALVFNCGEEYNENYRLSQALQFMQQLHQIDPYDHPRGIHNVNRPNNDYVDAEHIDLTSIQTGSPGSRTGLENALEHNRITIDWINRCLARRRRVLVVNFDEARPEEDRRCWWSVYLGGGVWETHVRQPYDRPPSAWEPAWTQLGGARVFMESLPFWEMQPHNELVVDGRAFCLAKPGHVYALYLPAGGSITMSLAANVGYDVAWWNPANGKDGSFEDKGQTTGGVQRFTAPGGGDWALRITRSQSRRPVAGVNRNASQAGKPGPQTLDRAGTQWAPFLEWSVQNPTFEGNPFDVLAAATFVHADSGEKRTTEMFHDGSSAWKFRFTGTRPGKWTFTTASQDADLAGLRGTVTITPNPDPKITGFLTHRGSKYAIERRHGHGLEGYLFNVYMGRVNLDAYLETFGTDPAGIATKTERYVAEALSNGCEIIFVHVNSNWFKFGVRGHNQHRRQDPDPTCFRVLETIITTAHRSGVRVHLWAWGDESRRWTPKGLPGGVNGQADRRLQRYIAARLGPLPGWTMGYGFDLHEWTSSGEVNAWARYLHEHFGWQHLLSARGIRLTGAGNINAYDGCGRDVELRTSRGGPEDYREIVAHLEGVTATPHLYEERHTYRRPGFQLDMDGTRRLLWWQAMAGGMGGFIGFYPVGIRAFGGHPYPHPDQLRTHYRFWHIHRRFRLDMERANDLTDGYCLRSVSRQHLVFYKEDAESVRMDLTAMRDPQPAVAVDTRKPYDELDLGKLAPAPQTWTAPYRSDWAVAVGEFER